MICLATEGYGLTIIRSDWLGGSACLASLAENVEDVWSMGRDVGMLASQRQRPSIGLPARHVVQGFCLICYVSHQYCVFALKLNADAFVFTES